MMASYCAVSKEKTTELFVALNSDPNSIDTFNSQSSTNSNKPNTSRNEKGDSRKSRLSDERSVTELGKKEAHNSSTDTHYSERSVNDEDERNKRPRSNSNGGFLLSNTIFERPFKYRHPSHERRKTRHLKTAQKSQARNNSNRLQIEDSQLAVKVDSMDLENKEMAQDTAGVGDIKKASEESRRLSSQNVSNGLDVDSAHIVNLALNLSENRRNASRRALYLPHISGGITESMGGGSLRLHLQNQRRISRIIPPSLNPNAQTLSASSRTSQRAASPLPALYYTQEKQVYQYNFSSSTLARAEKAKIAIELMAQYRRLLHFVPSLKSNSLERIKTASLTPLNSPAEPISSPPYDVFQPAIQLGREYNPLQYIRNRKLRARLSKSIDGEAQGFGSIETVTRWVDDVAQVASTCDFQYTQDYFLPDFAGDLNKEAPAKILSPRSNSAMAHAKIKRPRIDWIINPSDLIADLFWVEKDENKRLIEDRNGNKICLGHSLRKSSSIDFKAKEAHLARSSNPAKQDFDVQCETKSHEIKSSQHDPQRFPDTAAHKARQKLRVVRDVTLHHSSERRSRGRFRSRSTSSSPSLSSDVGYRRSSRGRISEDLQDHAKILLEKQILEMIAQEQTEKELSLEDDKISQSIEPRKPGLNFGMRNQNHSRSMRVTSIDLKNHGPPSRTSSENHGFMPHAPLECRDSTSESTAPNSPQARVKSIKNNGTHGNHSSNFAAVSSSTPTRRSTSVIRKNIKSSIKAHNLDQEIGHQSRELEKIRRPVSKARKVLDSNAESRRVNSPSPEKAVIKNSGSDKNRIGSEVNSTRKFKAEGERLSAFRGFLKSPRNPVTRVSEFLWKKESTPGTSSSFHGDESDSENLPVSQLEGEELRVIHGKNIYRSSRENSIGVNNEEKKRDSSYQDGSLRPRTKPFLATPFECGMKANNSYLNSSQQPKLQLPRIDAQDASPSLPVEMLERLRSDSIVSGISSNFDLGSLTVSEADARLSKAADYSDRHHNLLHIIKNSYVDRKRAPNCRQLWVCGRRIAMDSDILPNKEISRIRVILLSSGLKAREIQRRVANMKDASMSRLLPKAGPVPLCNSSTVLIPSIEQHKDEARKIFEDVQLLSQLLKANSDNFTQTSVVSLDSRIKILQSRLTESLTLMTRTATDEAEAVSRDLVMDYSLEVTHVMDQITQIMRQRGARFRWMRRKGWALLEWALIGIMWWVWFIVMIVRVFSGFAKGIIGVIKWMFWL